MAERAFQEQIPGNHCYGCGPDNARGLRLKSYWRGEVAVASFKPEPHHAAGPPQFLNGGVIATVIDCHCICTAMADAYRRENRVIGSSPRLWYATAALNVDYLAPAAIGAPLELTARIVEAGERKTRLACTAVSNGRECARAEVLAVRVPDDWRGG